MGNSFASLLLLGAAYAYDGDPAGQITFDSAAVVLMVIAGLLSFLVGIIGYFLRGSLTKIEEMAKEISKLQTDLCVLQEKSASKADVKVLEERVSSVNELKTVITAMRVELMSQLTSFREEWKREAAGLRDDIRDRTCNQPVPR